MNKVFRLCMIISAALVFAETTAASGALPAWSGTATYSTTTGPDAGGTTIVGPFDTYDFGAGIALIVENGSDFTGYYQTMVTSHLGANGSIAVDNFNIEGLTGDRSGFELTLAATFFGKVTASGFIITDGSAGLFFDEAGDDGFGPDYSFANDSGFENGTKILDGDIISGFGVMAPNGQGFESLTLDFSGLGNDVFDPGVGGGSSIFTLQTQQASNSPLFATVLNNSASVMGISVIGNDRFLAVADGTLSLTAVPVPAAVWLFSSALLSLVSVGARRKENN